MRIFVLTATYKLRVSRKSHLHDHPTSGWAYRVVVLNTFSDGFLYSTSADLTGLSFLTILCWYSTLGHDLCLHQKVYALHSPFVWRRNPTKTLSFLPGFMLSSPPYAQSFLRKPSFLVSADFFPWFLNPSNCLVFLELFSC
jgi:hypothetical protein